MPMNRVSDARQAVVSSSGATGQPSPDRKVEHLAEHQRTPFRRRAPRRAPRAARGPAEKPGSSSSARSAHSRAARRSRSPRRATAIAKAAGALSGCSLTDSSRKSTASREPLHRREQPGRRTAPGRSARRCGKQLSHTRISTRSTSPRIEPGRSAARPAAAASSSISRRRVVPGQPQARQHGLDGRLRDAPLSSGRRAEVVVRAGVDELVLHPGRRTAPDRPAHRPAAATNAPTTRLRAGSRGSTATPPRWRTYRASRSKFTISENPLPWQHHRRVRLRAQLHRRAVTLVGDERAGRADGQAGHELQAAHPADRHEHRGVVQGVAVVVAGQRRVSSADRPARRGLPLDQVVDGRGPARGRGPRATGNAAAPAVRRRGWRSSRGAGCRTRSSRCRPPALAATRRRACVPRRPAPAGRGGRRPAPRSRSGPASTSGRYDGWAAQAADPVGGEVGEHVGEAQSRRQLAQLPARTGTRTVPTRRRTRRCAARRRDRPAAGPAGDRCAGTPTTSRA